MIPIHTPADATPLPVSVRAPTRRRCENFALKIGDHTIHVTIERDASGHLFGLWVDMHKEGAPVRAMLNVIARLVSLCIQSGIPVARIAQHLSAAPFEPSGAVTDYEGRAPITNATSVCDLLGQLLRAEAP